MRRKRDSSLVARVRRAIPWMDDPEPIREVITTSEAGMQESEVWEHFVIHSEHKQIQKEKQDRAEKDIPDVNKYG